MKFYKKFLSLPGRVRQNNLGRLAIKKNYVNHIGLNLLIIISLLLINSVRINAQTFAWQKQFNSPSSADEAAVKVKSDGAGNVYVTGTSEEDIVTIKYNAAGVQQWLARYNNIWVDDYDGTHYDMEDKATDLQVDASGNVYVTGKTISALWWDVDYNIEVITIKYNASGTKLWEKTTTYVNTGIDELDDPHSYLDASGNLYVATSYSYDVNGDNDLEIDKLTSAGVTVWSRQFTAPGDVYAKANAIHVDASGNVYVTGSIDQNNGDYLTLKYNNAGTLQWQRYYNGSTTEEDIAVKIKTDGAGNIFVTGTSTFGDTDIITIKYNAAGVQQWAVRYDKTYTNEDGNLSHTDDAATDLQADASGNLYVTGKSSYPYLNASHIDVVTVKYNTSGTKLWEIPTTIAWLSHPEQVNDPYTAFDGAGNLYVSVSYFSDNTGNQLKINKLSPAGASLWAQTFTATGWLEVKANAMYVDAPGNIYITGRIDQNNGDYLTLKYAVPLITRINSGGPALITSLGKFSADAYLTGSSAINSSSAAIAGTTDDALYQTYRWANKPGGTFGYSIPVLNGNYSVKLHFSELFYTAAGKRKFNVTAEGAAWLNNYDIAADGGIKTAKVKTKTVKVTDGYLTLNFTSMLDNAVISAIEILPALAFAREDMELAEESSEVEVPSLQAFPNPFNDKITLSFTIRQTSQARLEVYDMQGRLIQRLFEGEAEGGRRYELEMDGASLPTGFYISRFATPYKIVNKKIVLAR